MYVQAEQWQSTAPIVDNSTQQYAQPVVHTNAMSSSASHHGGPDIKPPTGLLQQSQLLASMGVHNIKPLELPKFDGKPENYFRFRNRFRRLIEEDNTLSDYYKLTRLRECLAGGKAE